MASPNEPHYMRYGQFADLDALVYLRVRLARSFPQATIHDFAPSEYYEADADTLIVIGSPARNSKHQQFLPHLPIHYDTDHAANPRLVVPAHNNLILSPRRTEQGQLLADLTVVARLTLTGTTVFLLADCLSLGTSGAAKCFLHNARGADNARYLTDLIGDHDFVLITETHRIGGITETPDFSTTPPLLMLARYGHDAFQLISDNSGRWSG